MSSSQRRNNEQQHVFTRQATILRKNLFEWDHMLRTPRGELWPTMVGRLNAALNQTGTLDRSIDDVLEHFVYVPKQSPANPQDIPFFLSTRLAEENKGSSETAKRKDGAEDDDGEETPEEVIEESGALQILNKYENRAAQIANEYEENMVRF
mmetsp:Transcript_4081/g.6829  ORF Transcript_4081/g.6829 Transcript_4081/m.6829 type:complete len:152 (-) Transcript_4081:114-569(-)|eukprot:CAMPEP_0119014292 /NCGR_PEP_ID=MMETSP1176-20130426/9474_1 /TAXON_ID=265551 /ORGANISM="Synedropsis recta cf, Strain CCMP1620" /LENGTH=151 /DNA_ID=CAMNT_0006967447 /DNA_START=108 /DNA_END=563 /DNA_ORIENTATION=-